MVKAAGLPPHFHCRTSAAAGGGGGVWGGGGERVKSLCFTMTARDGYAAVDSLAGRIGDESADRGGTSEEFDGLKGRGAGRIGAGVERAESHVGKQGERRTPNI